MTNREWLIWQIIDMSDEELAEYFGCRMCDKYITPNEPCSGKDCSSLVLGWLKKEHKEDGT